MIVEDVGVGRIVYAWIVALTSLTLTACNKTASPPVAPPTPAAIESARVARRLSFISEADDDFMGGNTRFAQRAYSNEMRDKSPLVSLVAKRKLASVYEVLDQEKESLALLNELSAEKKSSIASDPLTILKTLYFSERRLFRLTRRHSFSAIPISHVSGWLSPRNLLRFRWAVTKVSWAASPAWWYPTRVEQNRKTRS